MRSVERPTFSSKETYNLCIEGIVDSGLKNRLEAVAEHIVDAAVEYVVRAMKLELHLVGQCNDVANIVTKDEMIELYNRRMARKGSPARAIYDTIKLLPEYGICPFCDHGPVSTLDHMLPKSSFPTLAVAPDNLVGSCKDCNHKKSAHVPSCAEECPLHPYFENLGDDRWLHATVVEGEVASVVFYFDLVDGWSDTLNARVRRQFDVLRLGRLYSSQAAREISGVRRMLTAKYNACGETGVRDELRHRSITWEEYDNNCWQTVSFRALSDSEWYCSGGFQRE